MSWGSTAPAAIAALLAAFTAAEDVDVTILDGPEPSGRYPQKALIIGWDGGADDIAGSAELAQQGLEVSPDREQYTIRNYIGVLDGAGNLANARTAALAVLAACGRAITADTTLGGAVMKAGVTGWRLGQPEDQRGAVAEVIFDVGIDAFTTR